MFTALDLAINQAGALKHSHVLGDGNERHIKPRHQLGNVVRTLGEKPNHLPARHIRQRVEDISQMIF